MALSDVLALLIDDYDPEAIYDGEEQTRKEAMIAFYGNESGYFNGEEPADVLESFEESYVGWFDRDEDFARDVADSMITLSDLSWPLNCIDWAEAANEILNGDYWTGDGYYFRSL